MVNWKGNGRNYLKEWQCWVTWRPLDSEKSAIYSTVDQHITVTCFYISKTSRSHPEIINLILTGIFTRATSFIVTFEFHPLG
jgi:hypothetical protein